ncbi:MAG: ferrochelatase [Kineosporiaceae bacterium]
MRPPDPDPRTGTPTRSGPGDLPPPSGSAGALHPYDGILLLSFGGPERPEDVLPFLENVTRGRGVPEERLAEVARHYADLGGRSPINDHNRALLAALRADLDARGLDTPLFWGNRNWHPYLPEALREAHAAGARRLLVILTSAFSSYSGCRQYREDLAAALDTLAGDGLRLDVDRVRTYFNHPALAGAVIRAVTEARSRAPAGARLVFVTHALPVAAAQRSGPHGGAYLAEHRDLAASIAAGLVGAGPDRGGADPHPPDWDLVFCSRSGPPEQPWLEPDIEDHLRDLAARGVAGVVVVPLGFLSDHVEVVHDLDVAAARVAADLGLSWTRAATPGTDPGFVAGLVDLALERAAQARGEPVDAPTVGGLPAAPAVCPAGCCPAPRGPRPAACGADPDGGELRPGGVAG